MSETQNTASAPVFRWPDLSAYGVKLRMFSRQASQGGVSKIFAVTGDITPEIDEALQIIGFARLPWGTYALRDIGDPATFRQRFHRNLALTFPEARTLSEGDVCADGTILKQSEIFRDVGDINTRRVYGNPFNDEPPASYRPEAAPEAAPEASIEAGPVQPAVEEAPVPADNTPAVEPETVSEPAPAMVSDAPAEPVQEQPSEAVTAPLPATAGENREMVALNGNEQYLNESGELTAAGVTLRESIQSINAAIAVRDRANRELNFGGMEQIDGTPRRHLAAWSLLPVNAYPTSEQRPAYIKEVEFGRYPHAVGLIDERHLTHIFSDLYRAPDNLFLRKSRYDYAVEMRLTPAIRQSPVMSDQEISNLIGSRLVSAINDGDQPVDLTQVWRMIDGLAPDAPVPESVAKHYHSMLSLSLTRGAYSGRVSQSDNYQSMLSLMPHFTSREHTPTLLPHVAFALSRTLQYSDIPNGWKGFISRDDYGMLTQMLPAHLETAMTVGVNEPDMIPILRDQLPIGTDNIEFVEDSADPPTEMNVQVLNMLGLRDLRETAITIHGEEHPMRADFAQVFSYLDWRNKDGRSVILLDANGIEAKEFLTELARGYLINGIVEIEPQSMGMSVAGRPMLGISLGVRRPAPLPAVDVADSAKVTKAANSRDLWTWASVTLVQHSSNQEIAASFNIDGISRTQGDAIANDYQEPYASLSHVGVPITMTPARQAQAQKQAQARVQKFIESKGFNDVDNFVASLLAIEPEELGGILSPEQVDAIATAESRLAQDPVNGDSILIADNTGVGKTRTNCGLMKARLMAGQTGVYMTEYGASFGAIYQELIALKSEEYIRPLMLNDQPITNKITNEIIIPATPRHIIRGLMTRRLEPDCRKMMECLILTGPAAARLRNRWKNMLKTLLEIGGISRLPGFNQEAYFDHLNAGNLVIENNVQNDEQENADNAEAVAAENGEVTQDEAEIVPPSIFEGDEPLFTMTDYLQMKTVMTEYHAGGQITLLEGETLGLLHGLVQEQDIAARHFERAAYNLVLSSYSQTNLPSSKTQQSKGRQTSATIAESGNKKIKAIRPAAKADWITGVVANTEGLMVVLDECHMAASDNSNISRNMDELVEYSENLVYSSATWLKGVSGMRLYRRMFPSEVNYKMIQALMNQGDETIHEVVTRMMVETGSYLRRELDMSKCTYNTVKEDRYLERNIALVDAMSPVWSAIDVLSGALQERITLLNEALTASREIELATTGTKSKERNIPAFSQESISSPLSRLENTFNNIMLMDSVADRAIWHLQEGRKPLIAIDGTNEGYIRSFYNNRGRLPTLRDLLMNIVDRISNISYRGENVKILKSPVYQDIADEALDRVVSRLPECLTRNIPVSVDDASAQVEAIRAILVEENAKDVRDVIAKWCWDEIMALMNAENPLFSDAQISDYFQAMESINSHALINVNGTIQNVLRQVQLMQEHMPENHNAQVTEIRKLIQEVPDMQINPLDYIRQRIEEAGYTCGEMTGRATIVKGDEIVPRLIRDKGEIRGMFNSGRIDAMMLTKAAASSQDFQADARFNDQRQRVTLFCGSQPEANVFAQIAGRTMRNGQTSFPWYEVFDSGMPVTTRMFSILYAKLRSMFALSTSNRENALIDSDSIDMTNRIGDKICGRYMIDHPEIAKQIGVQYSLERQMNKNGEIDTSKAQASLNAKQILGKIATRLPYHDQARTLREIEANYQAEIEQLNREGRNPLKTAELVGESQIVSRRLIRNVANEEAVGENSVFSQPVYLSTVRTFKQQTPISIETAALAIEQERTRLAETPAERAALLWNRRDEILMAYKGADTKHVDDIMAIYNDPNADQNLRLSPYLPSNYRTLKHLCETLRSIELGGMLYADSMFGGGFCSENKTLSGYMAVHLKMPAPYSADVMSFNQYVLTTLSPCDETFTTDRLTLVANRIGNGTNQRTEITAPDTGLNSPDLSRFMEQWKEREQTLLSKHVQFGQESKVLTGNTLIAMKMVLEGKFGQPVVFRTDTGPVHGVLIVHDDKFHEYNSILETPEIATEVLEKMGKIKFNSSPETLISGPVSKPLTPDTENAPETTSRRRRRNQSPSTPKVDAKPYRLSLPSPDAYPSFYEGAGIESWVEAHFGSLENLSAANTLKRGVSKIVVKGTLEQAKELTGILISGGFDCSNDNSSPNAREALLTIRQSFDTHEAEQAISQQVVPEPEDDEPQRGNQVNLGM